MTRRTVARFFFLNPDKVGIVASLYWYITAVIALKYGIQLHAVQVLSTHIHEVVTDTNGNLPAFLRERNRLFALALKTFRGIDGAVFSSDPPSCVALYGEAAIVKQIAYTLANCVEAGLARSPEEWAGVTMSARDIGTRVVLARRPSFFFRATNPQWPEEIELPITMPPALVTRYGSEREASSVVCDAVDLAVESARDAMIKSGRSFAKPSRIFRTDISVRATSREPIRDRNPSVAAGGNREERTRAEEDSEAFQEAYRAALKRVKRGESSVAFPFGTWRYCRELGFPMAKAA